jgi:hypothetical protein
MVRAKVLIQSFAQRQPSTMQTLLDRVFRHIQDVGSAAGKRSRSLALSVNPLVSRGWTTVIGTPELTTKSAAMRSRWNIVFSAR